MTLSLTVAAVALLVIVSLLAALSRSLLEVSESALEPYLQMADAPAPDLMIRTGGESRMSNFMLWQMAYTELYFTDLLWPEFTPESLDQAIAWFAKRDRRFGGESTVPAPTIESKAS